MIICNVSCPIFFKCKDQHDGQRCIYDMGIPEEKKDDDEFFDRLTY